MFSTAVPAGRFPRVHHSPTPSSLPSRSPKAPAASSSHQSLLFHFNQSPSLDCNQDRLPAMAMKAIAPSLRPLSPSSLYKRRPELPGSHLSPPLALASLRSSPHVALPPPESQDVPPVRSLICRLEVSPKRADAALSFTLQSCVRISPSHRRRTAGAPQSFEA
jgi:hypothetical protein